jgi:hypothetical protein
MTVRSPFDGLRIPRELVCEFFAIFARLEFALKEEGFIQQGRKRAYPDWDRFAKEAVAFLHILPGSGAAAAVEYLNSNPPEVQTATLTWEKAPLAGDAPVERALHAVTRVRNNLFHGGKHTPHSPEGRDEKLVVCSLQLMYACLEQNGRLRATFEQTDFQVTLPVNVG